MEFLKDQSGLLIKEKQRWDIVKQEKEKDNDNDKKELDSKKQKVIMFKDKYGKQLIIYLKAI